MTRACPSCGDPLDDRTTTCPSCGAVVGTEVVWECPDCGRIHQKHAPPCSRCGAPTLDRTYPEYDLSDVSRTVRYRDVLEPEYLVVGVIVIVLLAAGVLGAVGVIDLPGATGPTGPTSLDAPGHHDAFAGHETSRIETVWLWGLSDRRERLGRPDLGRSDTLDRFATVFAHAAVIGDHRPTATVEPRDALPSTTPAECERIRLYDARVDRADLTDRSSPGSIASDLTLDVESDRSAPETADATLAGIHVHVGPEGALYVSVATC